MWLQIQMPAVLQLHSLAFVSSNIFNMLEFHFVLAEIAIDDSACPCVLRCASSSPSHCQRRKKPKVWEGQIFAFDPHPQHARDMQRLGNKATNRTSRVWYCTKECQWIANNNNDNRKWYEPIPPIMFMIAHAYVVSWCPINPRRIRFEQKINCNNNK